MTVGGTGEREMSVAEGGTTDSAVGTDGRGSRKQAHQRELAVDLNDLVEPELGLEGQVEVLNGTRLGR